MGNLTPSARLPSALRGSTAKRKAHRDARDEHTPDFWVVRDPALERLTGTHPFNAELPLAEVARDFLTPPARGYVRSHGTTPRLDASTHRLEVKGLGIPAEGGGSRTFTVAELQQNFPAHKVTVTFCCSGNRRKEVNAVKPSIGVPFGVGAVQTGTFRGVRLPGLLRSCGWSREAAVRACQIAEGGGSGVCFINFAGPATELPRGDYGTTLLANYALEPSNEVLIAYEFNGAPLLPDHGCPLRCVIPGFIGGRMVKWLTTIEVASHESESHYYYHDNRLLPSTVGDLEEASKGQWWSKPEYIIGEMNINSAITHPDHGQIVQVEGAAPDAHVEFQGFAYSGGGRRVVIVELSLDDGKTWATTDFVPHPSDRPSPAGKFWTWRLWRLKVPLSQLVCTDSEGDGHGYHEDETEYTPQCPVVKIRAWDSSFNTQPEAISWNILGMMNASQYRVQVERCRAADGHGAVTFFHPQPPHNINFHKEVGRPPCEVEIRERPQVEPASTAGKEGRFTKREVARHNKEDDLWLIVNGQVFDVTTFLNDHPGGAGIITINGGAVCQEFDDIHSEHAHKMLREYHMGELVEDVGEEEGPAVAAAAGAAEEETKIEPGAATGVERETGTAGAAAEYGKEGAGGTAETEAFLDPGVFKACPLIQKEALSHDTKRFRFALTHPDQPLGLPVGHHLYLRATIHNEMVMRPYTPTSLTTERGSFELVVKIYRAHEDPKHPLGGKMSQFLDRLHIGDTMDVKGPLGRLVYRGRGWFESRGSRHFPQPKSRLGMIAGGTGITPIYQLLRTIHEDAFDTTRASLLFANKTPEDILLRPELDRLARDAEQRLPHGEAHNAWFQTWYTVDRIPLEHGPESWPYDVGHINSNMVAAHLPPPGPETLILICGPPPLVEYAAKPALEKLGYDLETMTYVF